MGYELRRWLADRLPASLSSGERLVALEIADQANEKTRRAYGSKTRTIILRRTGYADEKQLGKVLTKLAKNGIEMREPVRGKEGEPVRDKRGRVMYACNGHEMSEFVVPRLEDLPSCPERGTFPDEGAPPGPKAAPDGGPSGAKVPRLVPKVPPGGHPSPQSPQENSSSLLSPTGRADVTNPPPGERGDLQREEQPQPPLNVPTVPDIPAELVAEVMEKTTATAEEFVRIVEAARRDGIRTPGPWLRSDAGAENFRQRLADLRAAPSNARPGPPDVGDYRAAVRAACEHGTPGGSARCPLCRRQAPTQPPLAESQDPATATPRDLTTLRETLGSLTTRSGPRRPALDIRPRQDPDEPPAEVQAAHSYLDRFGDRKFDLIAAAREKLGPETHRNEVFVLAAELARDNTRQSIPEAS